MRDLVRYRGSPLTAANDRHTRNLLFCRRPLHSACASPNGAAKLASRGARSCGPVPGKLCLELDPGEPPSPVKLVLLVTSISFWWYCNNIVASVLVGIALFEVFHDVQYLSLVWIYNRKRVETDSSIGGFMRFVFRRSGALVGLYIGLIFAYGALGYFKSSVGIDVVKRILTGVVTASALLHFYYDGFIWKVREKSTRQSLGIGGGT